MAPRVGCLNRQKHIDGYLFKMKHASIRVREEAPDFYYLPDNVHDWTYSLYCKVEELLDQSRRCHVTLSHNVDANLMHDVSTGISATGILSTSKTLNGIPRHRPL
jgi:hypothetical protein